MDRVLWIISLRNHVHPTEVYVLTVGISQQSSTGSALPQIRLAGCIDEPVDIQKHSRNLCTTVPRPYGCTEVGHRIPAEAPFPVNMAQDEDFDCWSVMDMVNKNKRWKQSLCRKLHTPWISKYTCSSPILGLETVGLSNFCLLLDCAYEDFLRLGDRSMHPAYAPRIFHIGKNGLLEPLSHVPA